MNRKIIVAACLVGVCCISALGQIADIVKTIPEGKWVLAPESVKAQKTCIHEEVTHAREIRIDSLNVEIFTQISVIQDTLFISSAKETLRTKYEYTKRTGIQFNNKSIPFLCGGNVIADKLYLQQRIIDPTDETDPIYVSFIFEYKSN